MDATREPSHIELGNLTAVGFQNFVSSYSWPLFEHKVPGSSVCELAGNIRNVLYVISIFTLCCAAPSLDFFQRVCDWLLRPACGFPFFGTSQDNNWIQYIVNSNIYTMFQYMLGIINPDPVMNDGLKTDQPKIYKTKTVWILRRSSGPLDPWNKIGRQRHPSTAMAATDREILPRGVVAHGVPFILFLQFEGGIQVTFFCWYSKRMISRSPLYFLQVMKHTSFRSQRQNNRSGFQHEKQETNLDGISCRTPLPRSMPTTMAWSAVRSSPDGGMEFLKPKWMVKQSKWWILWVTSFFLGRLSVFG